jgi:hypothetical protein
MKPAFAKIKADFTDEQRVNDDRQDFHVSDRFQSSVWRRELTTADAAARLKFEI